MEKFATLIDVINKSLEDANNLQVFKVQNFLKAMETEFVRWGFRNNEKSGVDNILLMRLDAVGDFILTTPAIREVRMNFPHAHITLVVSTRAYPLAEFCPYVNEVLPFDMEFNLEDAPEVIYNVGNFAREHLWHRQFRLAFSFRYFNDWYPLQLFMIYLSGARIRVGYNQNAGLIYTGKQPSNSRDISKKILTHPIPANPNLKGDTERSLFLLKAIGLQVNHTNLELWYNAANVFDAKYYLRDFAPGRIKILAGIGASHPVKSYPIEKYLVAFKAIIEKGGAIVIAGGPNDIDNAKFLKDNLPAEYVKNLLEIKPSWRMTAAVTSQMDMYIGNDTGMVHCAAALHKPVIVLTRVAKHHPTPNEIETYHPYQTPAIVIQPDYQLGECREDPHYTGCKKYETHCITQIEPEEIIAAYEKIAGVIELLVGSE